MKMFRNLSIFVLAFLSILVVSFYGCQKEGAQVSQKVTNTEQNLQVELRAAHCGGEITPVQATFASGKDCYPANCEPDRTGSDKKSGGFLLWKKTNDPLIPINFDRGQAPGTELDRAKGGTPSGYAAHHIIAWNLRNNVLVQLAGQVGHQIKVNEILQYYHVFTSIY
jgi:hypothetical protein